MVTRIDGNENTSDIEKCVMELVGECEVSSQKCAKVIQATSKLFSSEIPLCELPSSNTVIHMMDGAQVLNSFQVAEKMLSSDRWNLHMDGTSRDHKKI